MTNFTDTPEFDTLRSYFISWKNAAMQAYAEGNYTVGDKIADRCTGVLDSILLLMGESLQDERAREHWTARLLYGK